MYNLINICKILILTMTLLFEEHNAKNSLELSNSNSLPCAYFSSYIQGKQILIERMKLYSVYKALHKLL